MNILFRVAFLTIFTFTSNIQIAWAAPPASSDEIVSQQQKEFDEALVFYRTATDIGGGPSQSSVVRIAELAIKENPFALEWIRNETVKNSDAIVALGYYYGAKNDGNNAVAQFKKAAQLGHKQAFNALASIFSEGWYGVTKNSKVGCEWYKKSAEAGNFRDAVEYGYCVGLPVAGINRDMNESCRWGEVGANGYADEIASVQKMIPKGSAIDPKYDAAVKAEAARAYTLFALCLQDNLDAKSRIAEAARWYKKAADFGNTYASFAYGDLLEQGRGVVQDYAEAVRWYRVAAERGSAEGQNRLGVKYAEGKGAQKNPVESLKWFIIAAANGEEKAVDNRDKAEKSLNAVQVKKAQGLATEWMKNKSK